MSEPQQDNEAAGGRSDSTAELGKSLTEQDVRRIARDEIAAREAAYARQEEESKWR